MLVSLVTFPMMAGLGVVASPLTRVVLGAKWVGAIPIFIALAPVGLVQSVASLVGQIYTARARTDLMFPWSIITCVFSIAAFLVGVHFQALGVVVAYCIVYCGLLIYPGFIIPFALIDLKFKSFAGALFPQFIITIAMTGTCLAWMRILVVLDISSPRIVLVTTVFVGAVLYMGAIVVLRPPVVDVLREVLRGFDRPRLARFLKSVSKLPMLKIWGQFTPILEVSGRDDL